MAFTNDYDTTKPVDHQKFIDIPGLIRTLKSDLAERLADMISGFTSGETTEGIKKLILQELSADPTAATDIGHLYCKDVAGATELFYQDASGNVKQLTTGGKLNVEATEAVLLSGDQTVAGIKTLSDQPVLSAGVKTDTISENTADAGVTVDGCLIKDGQVADSLKLGGGAFTDHIAILTGTVSNGGTIPLPTGYTEAQCKWMVSLNHVLATCDQNASYAENLYCSADGTRVVTIEEAGGNGINAANGTANYMIIGIK